MPPAAPSVSERRSALALGAWVALGLAGTRGALLFAMELAHHRSAELARARLASASVSACLGAAGLALAALALARARGGWRRAASALLVLLVLAYLAGGLDPEPARRIGSDTARGHLAVACMTAAALLLVAFVALGRLRTLRAVLAGSPRRALAPLALALLAGLALRLAPASLGPALELLVVEDELAGARWEVVRARADAPPAPAVLAPSAGPARLALRLAPPARVRCVVPAGGGALELRGGAGVDRAVSTEAAESYPGHALRFRAWVDGAQVFETAVALAEAPGWVELAVPSLAGGAVLELETALLDAQGREVEPPDPLAAGFGDLALVRRRRVERTRASPAAPSLVLVLIDTLRADRTSAYGCARATTPHLDALAGRGVLFEEVSSSSSWTWPATASLLTGLAPEQHGVLDAARSFLAQRLDTLPEALQRAGFTTAAWSGSPLIVAEKHFDQGFEAFDGGERLRRAELLLPDALEWLGRAAAWRFFLYLHLVEPHAPYEPRPEARARFAPDARAELDARALLARQGELRRAGFSERGEPRTEGIVSPDEQRWLHDLYDGCVWSADHALGRVLARLAELGVEQSTIVAVTSDHGEELLERGLLGHGHGLHRELIHVPLVIAGPGLARGERVGTPLSLQALGPTLARLCGARLDGAGGALDLFEPAPAPALFSTRQGWWNGADGLVLHGLRDGSHVLLVAPEGKPWGAPPDAAGAGELRLYDLARDPEERVDLAAREPELARTLRTELERRLAAFGPPPIPLAGDDEAARALLRALGY